MDLSKHFKLEDFVSNEKIAHYRRVCINILEPIRQRFGTIILDKEHPVFFLSKSQVRFKVIGFDGETIGRYVEDNLIHSCVDWGEEWIHVSCDKDA